MDGWLLITVVPHASASRSRIAPIFASACGPDAVLRRVVRIALILMLVMAFTTPASAQDRDAFIPGDEEVSPDAAPERVVELPKGVAAREGEVVNSLRVTGNRRVESESVLAQVRSEEGKPLRLAEISEDIKRIYRLGYFEDVQVDATKTADGKVVVTFVVDEKPAIAKIAYEGQKKLALDDIKEVVNLKVNQVLNVSDVKANAEKIRELYSEKGFYLAEVTYEIKPDDTIPGASVVTFVIREYAKVEVKKITILGNANIPDGDLKNIMATREGDFSSLITSFGTFKEEAFEADLQRLMAYYYDKGYVEVNVARPSIRLSRDKRYIYVTINVTEGAQYTTGDVELQGDFIKPKEELEELVKLESDKTFSYGTARSDSERIRDLYMDAGYAYVNVNPLMRPRAGATKEAIVDGESVEVPAHIVDVTYDIQKGNKVYFGRIDLVGNAKTRDNVIRRELKIEEGQLYSNSSLETSRQNVMRLGFFEKVEITTQRGDRSDVINARVEVSERPTGTFQVGAGLSSLESFILNMQISQNNFLGHGQSISFNTQASAIRTFFNFQFSEPWLFDTKLQFSVDAYNFDFLFQDFGRRSRGGNMSLGYPISDLIPFMPSGYQAVLSLTYKLEHVKLTPGGRSQRQGQGVGNLFRGGLTSSLRGGLSLDHRDNRLFPTKGGFHTARVEVADDGITRSQNEFAKYDAETRWYFPLFWNFVLRLNGEIGYVQSIDAHKPVPLFERYFVGGPLTVRGFDRFSLGPSRDVAANPSDPSSSLDDFQIGGNKRLILTAEIEFPILTAVGIRGVLFADAGNAFDNGQPITLKLDLFSDDDQDYRDALRTAVGFGVRWFSPIGPLRFEWGIPLSRLRDEEPLVFDFSLGSPF